MTPDSNNAPSSSGINTARFWGIIVAISFAGVLIALEATILSTALPTIIADLGGGDNFVWVINAYLLAT